MESYNYPTHCSFCHEAFALLDTFLKEDNKGYHSKCYHDFCVNRRRNQQLGEELDSEQEELLKKFMATPNPLAACFEEILIRWDALGTHKDDDFGEVYEVMEIGRQIWKELNK